MKDPRRVEKRRCLWMKWYKNKSADSLITVALLLLPPKQNLVSLISASIQYEVLQHSFFRCFVHRCCGCSRLLSKRCPPHAERIGTQGPNLRCRYSQPEWVSSRAILQLSILRQALSQLSATLRVLLQYMSQCPLRYKG